jgi:hypothetical protein
MKLSDFQKKIINSILDGKCTRIDSFLNEYGELTKEKTKGNSYVGHTSFSKDTIVNVPKNRVLTYTRLKEYVSLWDRLQNMGLIYTISLDLQHQEIFPLFTTNLDPDTAMLSIIREHNQKEIIPLPDLPDFVVRGYMTTEEYFLHEENHDRKKAQRLTVIIAIISIVAALLSSLFQYLTYTTERQVIIKNQSAFPDTTKVILLNSISLPIDTLYLPTKKINK